ncbi:T-box transcription factor TBX6 [Taenia solium]|eukprot:TsM_001212100 transcript=TsM_001212100 gene=TsM_001212100
MAERNGESKGGVRKEASAEEGMGEASAMSSSQEIYSFLSVDMEENVYKALLTIARRVPNVLPADLNSEREEFSSICVGGIDSEPSEHPRTILRLCDIATWRAAGSLQMEMFTNRIGSCIFPTLSVSVGGLKADKMFTLFLDLMPKDQNVYTYQSGRWLSSVTTKPHPPPNQDSLIYVPLEAFQLGSKIMARRVDFSSAKITTNANTSILRNQIFVHGMQIYLPRYHILRHLTAEEPALRQESGEGCRNKCLARLEHVSSYVIPGTEFVTVTKYHNRHIVELKIEINPNNAAIKRRRKH